MREFHCWLILLSLITLQMSLCKDAEKEIWTPIEFPTIIPVILTIPSLKIHKLEDICFFFCNMAVKQHQYAIMACVILVMQN